jgi:hypothetical protein
MTPKKGSLREQELVTAFLPVSLGQMMISPKMNRKRNTPSCGYPVSSQT